jgi:hypothetical protein
VSNAADVLGQLTPEVRFVDCGDNFQTVVCSRCGTDIAEWWAAAMEAAHEQQFADLRLATPCCGTRTALTDLFYSPAVGFARYTLAVVNLRVGGVPPRTIERLQTVLGCELKLIWAHY